MDFRDERREPYPWANLASSLDGRKVAGLADALQGVQSGVVRIPLLVRGFRRQAAKQLLRQRGSGIIPELQAWFKEVQLTYTDREQVALEVLWCHQTARQINSELLQHLLESLDPGIRSAAVRVLSHWKYELPWSLNGSINSSPMHTARPT